jgi:pyridoxine 5'-phosphate synthase PdxJ
LSDETKDETVHDLRQIVKAEFGTMRAVSSDCCIVAANKASNTDCIISEHLLQVFTSHGWVVCM